MSAIHEISQKGLACFGSKENETLLAALALSHNHLSRRDIDVAHVQGGKLGGAATAIKQAQ